MKRTRNILGLVAGALIALSSGAHTFLGWPSIERELRLAKVPADLLVGMHISWGFGGLSMLAFALIVISLFLKRLKNETVTMLPAAIIGGAYVAVGAWAFVTSGYQPFYFVFILPGVLVLLALKD